MRPRVGAQHLVALQELAVLHPEGEPVPPQLQRFGKPGRKSERVRFPGLAKKNYRTQAKTILPLVRHLMFDDGGLEDSRLAHLVGLDTVDEVGRLGPQTGHQRADRDLELRPRGRRPPAGRASWVS